MHWQVRLLGASVLGTGGVKRSRGLVDVGGSLFDGCLGCGDALVGSDLVSEGALRGSSRLAGNPLRGSPVASGRIGRVLSGAGLLLRLRQQAGDLVTLGPGGPGKISEPRLDDPAPLDHRLLRAHPCSRGLCLGASGTNGGVCRGELVFVGFQHLDGMNHLINVAGVTKHYKDFALDDVNLVVDPGEIVGLIGRNGAGKTTLIKSLLGIIRTNNGTIELLDDADEHAAATHERVGVVFDICPFVGEMRVSDVASLGKATFATWDATKFDGLCRNFSLDEGKRVKELSRGMCTTHP